MSDIIVLDTGVLGMLVHPAETGEPWECKTWLKRVVLRGVLVYVPEIADYELRRELMRMKSSDRSSASTKMSAIALRADYYGGDAERGGTLGGGTECGKAHG